MATVWTLDEDKLITQLERPVKDLQDLGIPNAAQIVEDLPEGERQILTVQSYTMIGANWRASSADPNAQCQPHIQLRGTPSPSSKVTNGYIRFVDVQVLRTPSYSARHKQINLFMDYRAMPQILEQLQHAQRYLWVGHFANGHIYGDLHSAP
ncbi:hypothetical protein [uncultured Shimia sp.]|uniref:hypothetical protein n=1 Tax=uncultured Shimia sp. TaxID=573152 RepID=UPI0025FB48D5|nr:hypothetical protein [uncultured Shimia sp.]